MPRYGFQLSELFSSRVIGACSLSSVVKSHSPLGMVSPSGVLKPISRSACILQAGNRTLLLYSSRDGFLYLIASVRFSGHDILKSPWNQSSKIHGMALSVDVLFSLWPWIAVTAVVLPLLSHPDRLIVIPPPSER